MDYDPFECPKEQVGVQGYTSYVLPWAALPSPILTSRIR